VTFLVGGSEFPKFQKNNIKSVGSIDNLRTYPCASDIAIVPIGHGGGTKLKVLDYLSFGMPMVTTEKGIEGLKVRHNEEALVSRDADEQFLANLKHLIDNESKRIRIGMNARVLAEREYDWTAIGTKLNDLYQRLSKHV
jgi:glycosyltransferase involved in cell wall biosynthesis